MKPSRNSACAVVSKGMRESSHLHRSFATGSSVGFVASLVVMKILRARYSSTLKSRADGETNQVLSSRYGRTLGPFHVDGQYSHGGGHENRPKHQAEHSEHADAADYAYKDD